MNGYSTKSGIPCLWEEGGATTNTGKATIIAMADGKEPTAVYIPRWGHLSNGRHALIPIRIGYLVVQTFQSRGEFEHKIFRIASIVPGEVPLINLELIKQFDQGQWDKELTEQEKTLIEVSEFKAKYYQCCTVCYAKPKKK